MYFVTADKVSSSAFNAPINQHADMYSRAPTRCPLVTGALIYDTPPARALGGGVGVGLGLGGLGRV